VGRVQDVQDVQRVALTGHASVRMRQRGIRVEALAALLDFGCVRHLNSRNQSLARTSMNRRRPASR